MNTIVLFEEVQGSGSKTMQSFFKIATGLFALALSFNLIKQRGGINDVTAGLFAGLLVGFIVALFSETKLIMQIREDGIYVRFPPFQPSLTKYSWDAIRDLYVRKYDAIGEFYGWGIRAGHMKKGYIVSGNTGIQIEFYNNTSILITTQQPEQVEAVLRKLKKIS